MIHEAQQADQNQETRALSASMTILDHCFK
jgi:hypothetical protein